MCVHPGLEGFSDTHRRAPFNQWEAFEDQLTGCSLSQWEGVDEGRQIPEVGPGRRLVCLCLVWTDMQIWPFAGSCAIWRHTGCVQVLMSCIMKRLWDQVPPSTRALSGRFC